MKVRLFPALSLLGGALLGMLIAVPVESFAENAWLGDGLLLLSFSTTAIGALCCASLDP